MSSKKTERTHQKAAHRSSRIIFTAANVLHRVLKIDVFSFLTNDVRTVMTHVSLEHISQEYFKRGQNFLCTKRGNLLTFRLMPVITIRVERERSLEEKTFLMNFDALCLDILFHN